MANNSTITGRIVRGNAISGQTNTNVATMDHSKLNCRDNADQHPISAITGLTEELNNLNTDIVTAENHNTETKEALEAFKNDVKSTFEEQQEEYKALVSKEENRAKKAENNLNSSIEAEQERAIARENEIEDEIKESSGKKIEDEIKRAKAAEAKLAEDIAKNKEYTDTEITKVEEKITKEIDPKLQTLEKEITETKEYTDQEITKVEKKINDEIDPKLTDLSSKITSETTRATSIENNLAKTITEETDRAEEVEQDLDERLQRIEDTHSLEAITTITAERQTVKESELISANVFEADTDYYEYTYVADKSDFYGTWIWKIFDPDMLMYNPRWRNELHPQYWGWDAHLKYDYAKVDTEGKTTSKCSAFFSKYEWQGGKVYPISYLVGILYDSAYGGLMDDGWKDTCWPFFFEGFSNYTGWVDLHQRVMRFYEHTSEVSDTSILHYLQKFATKLSDNITNSLLVDESYIRTWQKANITEADFLANPTKYKKLNSTKVTSLTKATKYDSAVNYYINYNGLSTDDSTLRGTWLLDEKIDLSKLSNTVKGWYFFLNTDDTYLNKNCPMFDGFILKKSTDGTQLLAQRYQTCWSIEDSEVKGKYNYTDVAYDDEYVIYDTASGWVDERFRYISANNQYYYYDNSIDAGSKTNAHYDYSLIKFLQTFGHKISDELIGANYYTLDDYKAFLADNYGENKCFKSVGKITEAEFKAGTYYELTKTEAEKKTYKDVVRMSIKDIENKDTVLRGATGKDIIEITDDNAVVNGYYTLAPETAVNKKTYANIILENNSETTLTELTDWLAFEIPSNVQHGYCASVSLIIPERYDILPYLIDNKSEYSIKLIQAGSVIEKLELNGNCQYELLFLCNGVEIDVYIQEISLG